jgi:hypothetical protein
MVYLKQIHGNAFRELNFLNNKMRFQICAVLVVQLKTCFLFYSPTEGSIQEHKHKNFLYGHTL